MPLTEHTSNFNLEVSRGQVRGKRQLHKFGSNDAVGTTAEAVWSAGGAYTGFLTGADNIRIRAGGNANDTAAGSGAREVTVSILDENFEEQTVVLATAGASASASSALTAIRSTRAFVSATGTYGGANEGDIIIETDAGTELCRISAGEGQTQMAIYTVPADHKLYVSRLRAQVGGNNNEAFFDFCKREQADVTSAPFASLRLLERIEAVDSGGNVEIEFDPPLEIPGKTDVFVEATAGSGSVGVTASFCGVIVKDQPPNMELA